MEQEIFQVEINYNGKTVPVEIRTDLPDSPDDVDHEVWINGKHEFTINPHLDVCDEPCWRLKQTYEGNSIDLDLVSSVGEAIERHYL